MVLVLLLAGAAFGFSYALTVDKIRITGLQRIPQSTVRAVTDELRGANYLFMNRKTISGELEKIPYVDRSRLKYQFPRTLWVQITEKEPFMQVETNGGYVLVDEDFKGLEVTRNFKPDVPQLMGIPVSKEHLGLPIFQDTENQGKANFIQTLMRSKVAKDVRSVTILPQGMEIKTKDDGTVLVRSYREAEYKVAQLEAIRAKLESSNEKFDTILLDITDHPVAVRNGEETALLEGEQGAHLPSEGEKGEDSPQKEAPQENEGDS